MNTVHIVIIVLVILALIGIGILLYNQGKNCPICPICPVCPICPIPIITPTPTPTYGPTPTPTIGPTPTPTPTPTPGPTISPTPSPAPGLPKLVTYVEGWGDRQSIGTPENYTHAVLAFAVPYRYWGGLCSGLCTPWLSWYYNNDPSRTAADTIRDIKARNPNIKIIISMGGWSFDHFNWGGAGNNPQYQVSTDACGYVCKPPDPNMDDPANYTNTNLPTQYNCSPNTNSSLQPSSFCYGPNADKNVISHVGDTLIQIIDNLHADGFDLDMENTDLLGSADSHYLTDFIKNLTIYIKNKRPDLIATQAPMNAYMITDPQLNPAFVKQAVAYTNMLRQMRDYVDMILVQYYNTEPSDVTNPDAVVQSYQQIVNDVFAGDSRKVLVGMCSFAEPGTCQNCGPNCIYGQTRADTIVKPLMKKYGNNFGGVMQWAANGDNNGSFSTPIKNAFVNY